MKDWKNKFLSLIDSATNQVKTAVDSVNDMVNSFDWDAQAEYFDKMRKNLVKRTNELYNNFTELLKQVKDSLTDFSVTVPFDESIGEKLHYEVKDGKLVIEVTYSDETSERSNMTAVVIPENCDLEKISHTVNAALKTATITIPKVVPIKVEQPTEEEATPTNKPKKVVRKKTVKVETNNTEDENKSEESMTHISKKLSDKLQQNMAKTTLHRAPNGRFVRREVTN